MLHGYKKVYKYGIKIFYEDYTFVLLDEKLGDIS